MENLNNNPTLVSQNTHNANNQCVEEIATLTVLNTDQEREIEKGIVQDYLHTYGELI